MMTDQGLGQSRTPDQFLNGEPVSPQPTQHFKAAGIPCRFQHLPNDLAFGPRADQVCVPSSLSSFPVVS